MTIEQQADTLEVAMLTLGDGRLIMVPLMAIAEVKQLDAETRAGQGLGDLDWRELQLPIGSLDVSCGLDLPQQGELHSVAVFKAGSDCEPPFQALAFTGTAAHRRVSASVMEEAEIPASGHFVGATKIGEQVFLIPDLQRMLYAA